LLGKYKKVKEFCKKALLVSKKIGDKKAKAFPVASWEMCEHSLGGYPKAKECLEYALLICCQLGIPRNIGEGSTIYTNIGVLFESHSEYGKTK